MMLALLLLLARMDGPVPDPRFQEHWDQANQYYQDGQYQEALSLYQILLEEGVHNGRLHFNLGNAYFKTGQLGNAILHYCKARKYLPNDPDVTENLTIADESRVDKPIEDEDDAFLLGFDKLARSVPYGVVFNLALVLICLAGLASLMMVVRPHSDKWLGYVLVIGAVLGLVLLGTAHVQYRQLTRTDLAVLVEAKVDVLSGPSGRESVSFTIHEGMRCRILDETEGWYRIGLANGYNGWIPRTSVAII